MVMIWHIALVNDTSTPTIAVRRQTSNEEDEYELKGGHLLSWAPPHDANDKDQEEVTDERSNHGSHKVKPRINSGAKETEQMVVNDCFQISNEPALAAAEAARDPPAAKTPQSLA